MITICVYEVIVRGAPSNLVFFGVVWRRDMKCAWRGETLSMSAHKNFAEVDSLRDVFVSHTKKAVFLVAVIVAALVTGVYAYLELFSPRVTPQVTIVSSPLEFSMGLNKTEFQWGENITITFYLGNISNETIKVTWRGRFPIHPSYNGLTTEADRVTMADGAYLFHFGFVITDSNGTEVYKLLGGVFPAIYDIVFEPNGYIKQTLVQALYYGGDSQPLPKGTYQIRGILYRIGIQGLGGITLETPSITFVIR